MVVFLDDQQYVPTGGLPPTVDALIVGIRAHLAGSQRTVVLLSADGQAVAEDHISEVLMRNPADFQRLDLHTASVGELVQQSLEAAGAILQAAQAEQNRVIELLARGQVQSAIDVLAECIRGWTLVHDTLAKTIQLLELDINQLRCGDDTAASVLTEICQCFGEMKECLSSADYVLLNDLLQHEMMPVSARWERLLGAVAERVPTHATLKT